MNWLEVAREVVEQKQYAYVDRSGARMQVEPDKALDSEAILLDMFTASAMVAVYDALSDDYQERYSKLDVVKAADTAFRILRRLDADKKES